MDGAYSGYGDSPTGRPVYQTIATTPGKDYRVNFFWAANQQNGFTNHPNFFTGATTEQVAVSLGEQTQYTDVVNNASHGFVPWRQQSFTFTATAANSVLSFLAIGTPQGFPPYVFLDGVSAAAVPEPAAWAMLVAGFGLIGVMARRRTGLVAA
ncbi:MAG: PEPxxWA-CTERM sorting domain-containing protein [Sphingomonadaceae bacterium]|nr:PEPxxWA-CTERM sorting domain-containing protein [Sphingomonadaceae bacterium]